MAEELYFWMVKASLPGRKPYQTKWRLSEANARKTFGERLLERVDSSREVRNEGPTEVQPGYMSKIETLKR
jgi:hypothetical protein